MKALELILISHTIFFHYSYYLEMQLLIYEGEIH